MKFFFLYILLAFIFIACNKKEVIDQDKFVAIYVDIAIAQDTAQVSMEEIKKVVFKKHNITDAEYKSTIDYYNENPEEWQIVFDKALEKVNGKTKTKNNNI